MKLYLSKQKSDLFIKTSLWNSVIEVLKHETNIDISSYLVSVQLKWNTIFIKTNNPLIKSELNLFYDKISFSFNAKVKNLDLQSYDFEIKFI